MNEKVVYGFLVLLAKTTPVDKGKTLPPKVIDRKNFTQSSRPSEERNMRQRLHHPNALSRKKGRLFKQ
jgi:prophage DNA circulation protein